MQAIENEITRQRINARPRINIRERMGEDSWYRKAVMRLADVVSIVGPRPEQEPCLRYGAGERCFTTQRQCNACAVQDAWEESVLEIVREATGWSLWGFGMNSAHMTGRPFASWPSVYTHVRHPGVVVVSWSGGLDI